MGQRIIAGCRINFAVLSFEKSSRWSYVTGLYREAFVAGSLTGNHESILVGKDPYDHKAPLLSQHCQVHH